MRVSPATRADFERLQQLYFESSSRRAEIASDYYLAAYQDIDLFTGIVEISDADVLMAEDCGEPVGMAVVSVSSRPLSPNIIERSYVLVSSLVFRSDAVRDMLLAEAELWATARGIDHLQISLHALDSDTGKLYTGIGFAPETVLFTRAISREPSPIGLARGTVKLFPHSSSWETEANRTICELCELLPDIVIDIDHVGSTSIPTIPAKPIIDIAVAVYDFDKILEKQTLLRQHGYHFRASANESEEQLLFAKGSFYEGEGNLQTHFIHIVKVNSKQWFNYRNFRKYLCEFHEIATKYAELKLRLARENQGNDARKKYTDGKHDFICDILQKANEYYGL